MKNVLSLGKVAKSPCPSQAVFSDSTPLASFKSGAKGRPLLLLLFGQLRGSILVLTKEKQMGHVIDISNKECLLEEIYRVVQLLIPDISTLLAKAELQIEIIEMMLDNALGIDDTGKKRSAHYSLKLDD